ncbi:MAG TPA: fibronectin type III domain-containing protein [Pyrinomonadaceae bacterium]|nr:fibronectin type III domain-containing protein [Pyrinomonadaceae bacterium]
MAKIKLNFRSLTIPEKIARAQQVVAAMTGSTDFPTPSPALNAVTLAIDELEAAFNNAQAARREAKYRTGVQTEKEDRLHQLMTQLASYVESVAGGNEALITSAGLETRGAATADSSAPAAPETLTATTGNHEGEIELSWDAVRSARSYVVERATDPEAGPWTQAGVAPRSSLIIEGLESGKRYYFRVAAVTLNGQSPWSNHAVKVAP